MANVLAVLRIFRSISAACLNFNTCRCSIDRSRASILAKMAPTSAPFEVEAFAECDDISREIAPVSIQLDKGECDFERGRWRGALSFPSGQGA